MADFLNGTVQTPFGNVPKKTAALIVGGLILVVGIVWFRTRGATNTTVEAEINPATGYPYGSAEDAAELAKQAGYIAPGSSGGGGGGSGGNVGLITNAQWTQAVIQGMQSDGIVSDPAVLSAALGQYITGQPVTESAYRSLIEQAIAYQGYPPVSGPNGYPPAINTSTQPTPTPKPKPTPAPKPAPKSRPPRRYVRVARFTNGSDWRSYLDGIARHFGRSRGEVASWNKIAGPKYIVYTNQKIWVDPPGDYSGDKNVG